MTNVLIIGATSRIASIVADQIKDEDDINLALVVRNIQKLPKSLTTQNISVADATDSTMMAKIIKNQDIVYVSLNGDVISSAKTIVNAMKNTKSKRLIWTSSLGIYNEVPGEFGKLNNRALPQYLKTYRQAADIIENSNLDYTVIRPAWLVDVDEVSYETTHKPEPFKGTEVSRASVADYVKNTILHPEVDVRESVGIDKPGTDGNRPRKFVMEYNGFDPNM
ncbi:NAD(P)H-binding protein [Companilactobacillus sp.]|jgi:putative NADH-flavin reductase|uniref:NAD(P)H-binding protein n=1 Tax=Companilactobacillus sp. TaxID=2767905 RepID=UPI0025C6142C|nr:NAD(P)H-binding protein [Companilactobacillus sp.]MCH4008733.1 NAD(P)H-binding protein [Companilactobacillus sp.]MCH4051088.1 NAD(P)H-binding protein [Companilactobacillus sp.]MCH4076676.1 NAD(P)H-binding protein [Companilactobacillus sp.]MCH4125251.1 NAD(P)H-binding protein [Companilactobacillus sp.]MCH4131791.1 NAD(P)H-binding protein [Companilactobacillus sp.]